jgi:hypothetical protein
MSSQNHTRNKGSCFNLPVDKGQAQVNGAFLTFIPPPSSVRRNQRCPGRRVRPSDIIEHSNILNISAEILQDRDWLLIPSAPPREGFRRTPPLSRSICFLSEIRDRNQPDIWGAADRISDFWSAHAAQHGHSVVGSVPMQRISQLPLTWYSSWVIRSSLHRDYGRVRNAVCRWQRSDI